jgi:mitogen-activated protein kinase kinase kinase 1
MLYWAPEQASRQRYGSPADIWALGPTLLHLLKGRPPWYFLRPHQQHKRWEYATLKQAWCPYIKEDEDGEALGPEELQFLYQVMQQNPKDRPTAVELLAYSPYLRKAG